MRYAILSDIHANLEALDAVLADARALSCTEFVCLGDVVGYNASGQPSRESGNKLPGGKEITTSRLRSIPRERFNELAEEAIDWTRGNLSADDKVWLADLPLTRQVGDFTIVHATLDTPEQWGYVFNDLDAIASFTYQHTPLCFFGHTHWPTAFVRDDSVRRIPTGQVLLSAGKVFH
jgi:predicted phosphodiesterase